MFNKSFKNTETNLRLLFGFYPFDFSVNLRVQVKPFLQINLDFVHLKKKY